MAILPVRNLGTAGVVTDIEPYNLPIQAFSRADNVVFEDGKAKRAPIFKKMFSGAAEYQSAAFATQSASSGTDEFFVCDRSYQIAKWAYPTFVNVPQVSSTTYLQPDVNPAADTVPVSSTSLAEVVYFNKPDRRPIYKLPDEDFFRELHPKDSGTAASGVASSWGSLTDVWKCNTLRSYGDFLLALNVQEGSDVYPARVRWCDPVLNASAALTWDASDPTTLAGFNDIVQIEGGIVDGLSLGSQFVIYSKDQVWLMEFVGGQFVFNFRRLFTGAGIINANAVCEVDNNHYVFGPDDIYIHNGTQKESIAKGKVRDFIYGGLNTDKKHATFVHHDVRFKKVMFCYNSQDANVKYTNATHCNKAAVYSYSEGTWSFMDLPNLTCAGVGNLNSQITYDTDEGTATAPTYESLGGTYLDSAGSYARQSIFANRILRAETTTTDDTTVYTVLGSGSSTNTANPNLNYVNLNVGTNVASLFQAGDTILVSGFTGAGIDANGTFVVTTVLSDSIRYAKPSALTTLQGVSYPNATVTKVSDSPLQYPPSLVNSYHGLTETLLLTMDSISDPAVVAAYDSTLNSVAVLERKGIDLDETGQELRSYKNLKNIYPQMVSSDESQPNNSSYVTFSIGAADLPNNTPNYSTITNFQPSQMYQLNTRASGRYLSYKIETPDPRTYFSLTGFDADFVATSKR